jgi:MFS family permease
MAGSENQSTSKIAGPVSASAAATPSEPDGPRPWLERVAGALTHRNFRIVWFAALGSTIGTWMQTYAQAWLVFERTQSSFYLGLDVFLAQLPVILFMLIGGVVADRYDKRRLLTGSQFVQMFSALMLAVLLYTDTLRVWHIFALSFISGCGQAFGGPAYQSLLPTLVPRRDLPNAIALNSTQFNLSRVLGPTTGGIVLATIGAAACFALNSISFLFVVFALAALRLPPPPVTTTKRALGDELRSGLHYVRDHKLILTLTMLVFVSTFLTMPVLTLLPAFAKNVLTESSYAYETRFSMLQASQGLGAIVGALTIGSLGRFKHMGRALLLVQVAAGVLSAIFGQSHTFALSLILIFVLGMCFMALFSIGFSLVQLTVPDELRGRVVSIYMVALRAGWPLGGLVAGALSDRFGAPAVMALNGVLLILVAGTLLFVHRGHALADA